MSERVTVVTGAGSGIGRATAIAFARDGAKVMAADIDLQAVDGTVHMAEGSLIAVQTDVTDEASVRDLFERCDRELGTPTVLANIAGVGVTTNAAQTSLESWERVFAVNARGTFLCCKHAIPRMTAVGGGSIVNMGSIAALIGLPNRAAYCAAKGAVVALTRALAVDHAEQRVRVNCICPGTTQSPWLERLLDDAGESLEALIKRQPLGRLGTPEEIAAAILYVCSEAASFMTGSVLVIDGGATAG
jgi:NAD(P)-dependent dehydrogenase (short-subunit alcohol dehydrogenase family)